MSGKDLFAVPQGQPPKDSGLGFVNQLGLGQLQPEALCFALDGGEGICPKHGFLVNHLAFRCQAVFKVKTC